MLQYDQQLLGPSMRRLLFALIWFCLSAPTNADEAVHPGILIGTGTADWSGDCPYAPIGWCGEKLWLDADAGKSLIDPATRKATLISDKGDYEDFLGCQFVNGETILWTDAAEKGLIWRNLDHAQTGILTGVRRGDWGDPLIDFKGNLVVALTEPGKHIDISGEPTGVQIVALDSSLLAPTLQAIAERDNPKGPHQPSLLRLGLLSDRIVSVQMNRLLPRQPGGWQNKTDAITVFELDLAQGEPSLRNAWSIEDALRLAPEDEIAEVKFTAAGRLQFAVSRSEGWSECTREMTPSSQEISCRPLIANPGAAAEGEKIERRIGVTWHGKLAVAAVSPAGQWIAWGEWEPDDDQGKVRLYLIAADPLKP